MDKPTVTVNYEDYQSLVEFQRAIIDEHKEDLIIIYSDEGYVDSRLCVRKGEKAMATLIHQLKEMNKKEIEARRLYWDLRRFVPEKYLRSFDNR